MKHFKGPWIVLSLLALVAAGCGNEQTADTPSVGSDAVGKYTLATEPKGSIDVIKARKTTKDGDEIVIVGRVGGKEPLWIKGLAAFRIVDTSLKPCNADGTENCATPWDY